MATKTESCIMKMEDGTTLQEVKAFMQHIQITKELRIDPDLVETGGPLVRLEIDLLPLPVKIKAVVNEVAEEDATHTRNYFDKRLLSIIKEHLQDLSDELSLIEVVDFADVPRPDVLTICDPEELEPEISWVDEPVGGNVHK